MKSDRVIVRDVPYFVWLFGLVFAGVGLSIFLDRPSPRLLSGIFILGGLAIIAFIPVVTVLLDRGGGALVIQKTGILIRSRREVPMTRIARVYVQSRSNSDSTTYRIVMALEDGEEIPLRQYSSSGFRGKEKQAKAIRAALGLGREDHNQAWMPEEFQQGLSRIDMGDQEARTGVPSGLQETDGVQWELETFTFGGASGGSPVYRWSSTDFETPGHFLFLAQRIEGQGKQKGLMNLVGNFLIKQSIRMYGFDESYSPGIEDAVSLEDADRRLLDDFFVYTSSPVEARQILNPWVVMPLIGWADRYALEQREKKFHQLTVLFSPFGVFVSVLNTLDAAQVDELVALGVELIRAQGVSRQRGENV